MAQVIFTTFPPVLLRVRSGWVFSQHFSYKPVDISSQMAMANRKLKMADIYFVYLHGISCNHVADTILPKNGGLFFIYLASAVVV
jgi:hypothetical protein